jgi:hypothetical protein
MNRQDYFGADELNGMADERPPFGTERHRWLSTVAKLQEEIDRLRIENLRFKGEL